MTSKTKDPAFYYNDIEDFCENIGVLSDKNLLQLAETSLGLLIGRGWEVSIDGQEIKYGELYCRKVEELTS